MTVTTRHAESPDATLLLDFIQGLADYEKASDQVETTLADIRQTFFSERPRVHALIAEQQDKPVGFAAYFFNYSTWLGRHGIYLEDLFVDPAARGTGAGIALLRGIAKIAVAKGCRRVDWQVLDWNQPAIDFYRSIGARHQETWLPYRLEGEALESFAKEA